MPLNRFFLKYQIEILSLFSFIALYQLTENFKLVFIIIILLFIFYLYCLKSLFLSLYLLFFVTSFFLSPGKFYSFLVIPAGKVIIEPYFSQGLSDGFGFVASDFIAIALVFFFVWKFFKKTAKLQSINTLFKNDLSTALLSLGCFFVVGLYSAFFTSLNRTFSIVNLLQYQKIFIFLLATIYLLKKYSQGKVILEKLIVSTLVFNFFLSFLQLLGHLDSTFHSSLNLESSVQPDDQSFLPRIKGIFLASNELALFLSIFYGLLLHMNAKKYYKLLWIILFLLGVLLTQSRTVWIELIFCIIVFQGMELKNRLQKIWSQKEILFKKFWGVFFVSFAIILFILLPRLLALQYTFEGGSGSIRLEMIRDGWQIFQNSPIFGYGANTNVLILFDQIPLGAVSKFPQPIHMAYLQMALETGFLGSFFFFFPFVYFLYKLLKSSQIKRDWLLAAILTFLLIYYIFQPHGGRLEIPLLGILLAYICFNFSQKKRPKNFKLY